MIAWAGCLFANETYTDCIRWHTDCRGAQGPFTSVIAWAGCLFANETYTDCIRWHTDCRGAQGPFTSVIAWAYCATQHYAVVAFV